MKQLVLTGVTGKKLGRLKQPPQTLSYLGRNPDELVVRPIVAIVGTRKPTPYGKQVTEKLAAELARAGIIIISGLAYGVDITAHRTTLQAGGTTIAVLPSGLDTVYPSSHARVAEQIAEKGSVISEYEPSHKPYRHDFLERNRLIAALSDAVIIPEAAERSGSLNTAGHAHTLGIPVFAVPGNITSPMSGGTNHLIKTGAQLITGAHDVFELLGIDPNQSQQTELLGANDTETTLLQAIKSGTHDVNGLQRITSLDLSELQTTLTMLEITGRIEQDILGGWHLC